MKFCTKCKTSKPLDSFFRSSTSRDGRRGHCKVCLHFWYEKNKEKQRRRFVKKAFGIDVEAAAQIAKDQQNCCAICKRETKLCIDHSHTSGKFRGMLCTNCNSGLGHFKDNPDILRMAIYYLKIASVNGI